MAKTQDSMYWDIRRTSTHNCLLNFIVGNRGGGKSFGGKDWCIDRFIKKREQFMYVRRYEDDLKEPIETFFNDIGKKYPDYEYRNIGTKMYLRKRPPEGQEDTPWTDDDIMGYGMQLSTSSKKKSISYPRVTTIIVDEFLLEESGNQKYVQNEVRKFQDLYETVARPGTDHPDVVVWFLGNAISIVNPYFVEFDLRMPIGMDKNGKRIWKHPSGDILVEFVMNEEFVKRKEASRWGKITQGTKYADYATRGEFLLDDYTFIEKRTSGAKHMFNFICKGDKYGVWVDYQAGRMWVSDATDPSGITYSFTTEDHNINTLLLKRRNKDYHLKPFFETFKAGLLRFENINIKTNCYELFGTAWS